MDKKMIYIMNHYSKKSVQHFYHIINLLKSIADKGVKIVLIIEKAEDKLEEIHPNIRVVIQEKKGKFSRIIELIKLLKKYIKEGYNKIFIRISINSTIISIIVSRLYKAQTYYWQSGTTYDVDRNQSIIGRIKYFLNNGAKIWFIKTFVTYFVTGPESMIQYYSKVLKLKKEKILMLYNDIDLSRFKDSSVDKSLREKIDVKNDELLILMVHRLSPVRKTLKYIPKIMEDKEILKKAKLVIIGDGPEKEELEKNINNSIAKENIILLGNIPNSDIQKYYNIADIFINPSYTEGFPRVVIEAMASKLPIIATNAGGTIDLFLNKQKQYIVDRENVLEFRNKLKNLINNFDVREKLKQENIIQVKRFSTDNVSKMYIEGIFNNE